MAKATFKCAECGKNIEVGGKGYNAQRAKQLAKYKSERGDICHECQRKEWEDANTKAVAESSEKGLPELTGSPKQIAWASSIRLHMFEDFDEFSKEVSDYKRIYDQFSEQAVTEIQDACHLILKELRDEVSAHWWIENKYRPAQTLVEERLNKRYQQLAPTAYIEMQALRKA